MEYSILISPHSCYVNAVQRGLGPADLLKKSSWWEKEIYEDEADGRTASDWNSHPVHLTENSVCVTSVGKGWACQT